MWWWWWWWTRYFLSMGFIFFRGAWRRCFCFSFFRTPKSPSHGKEVDWTSSLLSALKKSSDFFFGSRSIPRIFEFSRLFPLSLRFADPLCNLGLSPVHITSCDHTFPRGPATTLVHIRAHFKMAAKCMVYCRLQVLVRAVFVIPINRENHL